MEESHSDRMAVPRKRGGRPTLGEVSARAAPSDAVPVVITLPNLPPMDGFRCPQCGRGQVPRITATDGQIRYCNCGLCGKRMKVEYTADGKARKVYPL